MNSMTQSCARGIALGLAYPGLMCHAFGENAGEV